MAKRLCTLIMALLTAGGAFALSNTEKSEGNEFTQTGRQEYCLTDTDEAFQARCLKNEVIVMKRAIYGRMVIGRCLEADGSHLLAATFGNDPLFLGCSVDVLHLLDARCSGRNQCELQGTDRDLVTKRPCHATLKSYLEADYECASVIEADRSCHVSVTSNPLHIMRSSTTTLSCGTKSQPWTLEAPAGQQINVSLLDFGQRARDPANQHLCQQYGHIVDRAANKNVSVCGLVDDRNILIHTSISHVIEIVLSSGNDPLESMPIQFLVRIEAIGCTNVIPPVDAWLRRSNNEAVVGCYTSRQSWHLRCVGDLWIGVIGNCTRETDDQSAIENETKVKQSTPAKYQLMVIVALAFAGVAICLIIICIGAVCWKRYYVQYQKYAPKVQENGRFGHVGYVQQQINPKVQPETC